MVEETGNGENGGVRIEPGHNCWRRTTADRAAFLVDAARYFAALRQALLKAERQIVILGWALDGRIRLRRDDGDDGSPETLRDLLDALCRQRPRLKVYILIWGYSLLYTRDQELLTAPAFHWRTSRRIRVYLDDSGPVGSCQHEKLVVIDDSLAFIGGIDLAAGRWDTSAHAPGDPRRVDHRGVAYRPFHDVQMAVDGQAAIDLGELARGRWRDAAGEDLARAAAGESPWPPGLEPSARKLPVAIARTRPQTDTGHAVHEIETLYLDAIASARFHIFIENQYITSDSISAALARRLEDPHGPEVVIVTNDRTGGWLEEQTMGVGAQAFLRRLKSADLHGRLAVFAPDLGPGVPEGLKVHSKVLVVDDAHLQIGSANLSNRSMGFDSECDLAIQARTQAHCTAVSLFRDGLLAEHLGSRRHDVAAAIAEAGSLIAALEKLNPPRGRRRLEPLDSEGASAPDLQELTVLGDPSEPGAVERMLDVTDTDSTAGERSAGGIIAVLALLAAVALLAAGWRLTPLAEMVEPERVMQWVESVRHTPLAPLATVILFVVLGLVAFPVTVLIATTALVLGAWTGFAYATVGTLASASVTFALGRAFRRSLWSRFAGAFMHRLSLRLRHSGLMTIIAVRLIPVAPFSVTNICAGASHMRFRDYLLGTILGMVPGIAIMSALGGRLDRLWRDPSGADIIAFVLLLLLWVMLGLGLQRLASRRRKWQDRPANA